MSRGRALSGIFGAMLDHLLRRSSTSVAGGARRAKLIDGVLPVDTAQAHALVNKIEQHLSRLDYWGPNAAMLARIRSTIDDGGPLSFADRNFLKHETTEMGLMDGGMDWDSAHAVALTKHPLFANYDPEVIRSMPDEFNSRWKHYWGIE